MAWKQLIIIVCLAAAAFATPVKKANEESLDDETTLFVVKSEASTSVTTRSTTTPSTTVPPPTPTRQPNSRAPLLVTNLQGEFRSVDGRNWTSECALASSATLNIRALLMVSTLNEVLRTRCPALAQGNVQVLTAATLLTTEGSQGFTFIDFFLESPGEATFREVWDCGLELGVFAEDLFNWGFPVLPQEPGCPYADFVDNKFVHERNDWFCDFTRQAQANQDFKASSLKEADGKVNDFYAPQYLVSLFEYYDTASGAIMPPICSAFYNRQLELKASQQIPVISDLLESGTVCPSYRGVSTDTINTVFTSAGAEGETIINVNLIGLASQTFNDVENCAFEVRDVLRPFAHWGLPLLVSEPQCPYPQFRSETFGDETTWIC